MWQWLIDLLFFKYIQKNYPGPGMLCTFGGHIRCMVMSNSPGNRAVVLHVQDDAWSNAYILLSYCLQAWRPWPTWVVGIIDNNVDGRVTRT